ncbi:MAG: PucR family transcriptional regulator [Corynebacterium flavescens]|uniref:PucR family transcriptional regulator n=1 Tax=Corynebacterium flavescens TaxID=28028 RepID=UPI002647F4AB|nr:PucR family transcriptional regulator [Corynebacterium flavescens]MDN6530812.1 PucR family transcriptional regulator [Corynebacterium flavescens]
MKVSKNLEVSLPVSQQRLSLSWLLSDERLGLRLIVTGQSWFWSIQSIELPDPGEYIDEGAIILLTGLGFADEPELFSGYAEILANKGAVGIGFGTGLRFDHVPPELIRAAQSKGLTLFEVPLPTPFISLTKKVQDERVRLARLQQESLLAAQEELNVAGGLGVRKLIQQASSQLQASLCIVDSDGRLISSHGIMAPQALKVAKCCLATKKTTSSAGNYEDSNYLIHRLDAHGDRFHLLVILAARPFSSYDRSIVKHCAGLADILVQRPASLRKARSELHTLALATLLGENSSSEILARVFESAADTTGRVRAAVVCGDSEHFLNRALTHFDAELAAANRYLFSLEVGSASTLLLFRGTRTPAEIREFFGPNAKSLRIAVGAPMHWSTLNLKIVEDLTVAARTLELGTLIGPQYVGTNWIAQAPVRKALDARSRQTIDRLIEHDTVHDTELVATLEAYLRAAGSLSATASATRVHRHTIRSRIELIAEICEVDLRDPFTRAELLLIILSRSA